MTNRMLLALVAVATVACDDNTPTVDRSATTAAPSPLAGKADGLDKADHDCRIVTRSATRIADGRGDHLRGDSNDWIWRGTVDVANQELVDGASVHVVYTSSNTDGWWKVRAWPIEQVAGDRTRFRFDFFAHTFGPYMSAGALERGVVKFIPVVETPNHNLWDHNARTGALDVFELHGKDGWAFADDETCAAGGTVWAGNVTSKFERADNHPCDGGKSMDAGFTYEGWARQRAAVRSVCFEAWSEGVTDWDNPDLWKQLDVQMHYRWDAQGEFTSVYVDQLDWIGNNARYHVDLKPFDLYAFGRCPEGPTRALPAGGEAADLWFYFTVNGVPVRPAAGGEFHGVFEGHPDAGFRAENCR